MDRKYIEKYWKEVRKRAWEGAMNKSGSGFAITATVLILVFVTGVSGFLFAVGVLTYPFYRDNILANVLTGAAQVIVAFVMLIIAYDRTIHEVVPAMYHEQEQIIQQRTVEILKLESVLQSKILNLIVEPGVNITVDVGGGTPSVTLVLDVVNQERKKVVELEAYLTRVEQVTEELPADWSYTYGITSFRAYRLEWKNKKYSIDLTPGFPESSVKIVSLDCSKPELTFINEGSPLRPSVLLKDALYKIKVNYKGKLEGETDYRFFEYETMFACAPNTSQIGFLHREKDNSNMPDWLRERIRLVLEGTR